MIKRWSVGMQRSTSPTEIIDYTPGDGSSITGGLYSFGSLATADRALGTLASQRQGFLAFGVRFINDTPFPRSNIVVAFTGEQWRAGSAQTQYLHFSFRVGAALTNADAGNAALWNPFPALSFASPNTNTAQALDGNTESNRTHISSALVGVIIGPGEELFLRWRDADDSGFDHALAIDDLVVTFGEALTNTQPPSASNRISIVTYNLKGNFASDWSTNAPQVQAIARQLRFLSADIIALNEIPNGLRYEMTNWMTAFFSDYHLSISPGTDGALRNGLMTQFSIIRSNSWLDGASLTNFGYDGTFTRDLFEAELAVPGYPQPLHVFVAHLKSGTSSSDDAARRGAEALAISNFFVTAFLSSNALHPYILAGDMNEDLAIPATGSQQPIQKLTNNTGVWLTTPLNPITGERFTHSIQSSNGLSRRYDYIFPCGILSSNIFSAQVFRSDVLTPEPDALFNPDSATASDHLPVKMIFNNPYKRPFRIRSLARSNNIVQIAFESQPGALYTVETTTNLFNPAAWTALTTNYFATNQAASFRMIVSEPATFFRIRVND